MSAINIDFGTRKGWGEPITEKTPFIEYWKYPRYGYFITVFDIVFRTIGAKDGKTKVVRLGIQKAKVDRDVDEDHPPMVYFESKISPSTDPESSMAQTSPALFVSSRLLKISGLDEDTLEIRLRERQALSADIRYATLSHCWGPLMPFKLKKELLESCLNGIPLAQMSSVYQHGVLNIAATGFSDGSNGLFVQRDPNLLTPISFSMEANDSSHDNYYLVDTGVWKDQVDDSPLCGRGWVAQERALSPRTVHFGKQQLFWECLCENASEVLPKGMLRGTEIMDPKAFIVPENEKEERAERLRSLREWVLGYNKRSYYEDSDDECNSDDDTSDKACSTDDGY
ncbi:HET-domain-containing protein [Fusarium austroafricanum]|uniref:HET-domain-containing protein n=1 Tax=Fusarium austroafricanum TaxID=2364996 RepID=A0A8H4JXJ7_9HYPO|nr:HET-domain-containing protein [Fusarium austroafricanum]